MTAGSKAATAAVTLHGLKRRALSLGAAKAFDYAMQFLLPVVLVRCLDAATFGEYRLLWLAVGTVMVIATMNMPQSLYFFLPRSDARMKRVYIAQTLAFLGVTGLIAAWAVSPWNPWLPSAIAPLARYGALVPVFVALWVITFMLDMLPTAEERVAWQAGVTIGLSLLRVVMLSLGAFFTGDLALLIWLLLAFVVLKLAVLLGYIARFHGFARPWFDRASFAGQFRHAAPIGVSSALYGLRSQSDQWIAAHLFTLGSFAAFSIAAVLGPLVNLFRQSVNEAFLPSMSRLQAAGDVRAMLELNSRANVMVGALLFPLLAFAFVFAEEVVSAIYTAAYLEAAPVMRVYILGLAGMVIEVGSIVLLLREGEYAVRVNMVALAASIAISWVAATRFGLPGAAAGSVLALYVDRAAILRRIASRAGIRFRDLQDWFGLAAAASFACLAAAIAWGAVQLYFAAQGPLVRLAAGAAILAAAYAAMPALLRMGKAGTVR